MSVQNSIAELLCTRLCHDLTGPIGAVNNGVEFLSEEGDDMQEQAIELISNSAQEAVTRLQFYRYAYGKVSDSGESSISDKQPLLEEFFKGLKIAIDWQENGKPACTLNGGMMRLLCNIMLIASSTLLKGGVLRVVCGKEGLSVSATGPMLKWEADMQSVLEGRASLDSLTPKSVQIFMTRQLAAAQNAHVATDYNAEHFNIAAVMQEQLAEPQF